MRSTRGSVASQVPVKLSRRQLIGSSVAAGATLGLAGGAAWYFTRDTDPKGASDRMDLLTWASDTPPPVFPEDLTYLVLVTITGGMPKNTRMEMRWFAPDGKPVVLDETPTATLTNLVTGEETPYTVTLMDDGGYRLDQDTIRSNGWWQVVTKVGQTLATWTLIVPDPNLTGFSTPPKIDTDPQASAMLAACLNKLSTSVSLRFWEWLSGGNGSIILANFSVTTPESNGLEPSFENQSLMAGRVPPDGGNATFRAENSRTVTIGSEGARSVNDGPSGPFSATNYLPISEYATSYDGRDGIHFGMQREVNGRDSQLIAFHLPGYQEAWFAFWVDMRTIEVHELFMISTYHYMHWIYYDVNEPFEIAFPD